GKRERHPREVAHLGAHAIALLEERARALAVSALLRHHAEVVQRDAENESIARRLRERTRLVQQRDRVLEAVDIRDRVAEGERQRAGSIGFARAGNRPIGEGPSVVAELVAEVARPVERAGADRARLRRRPLERRDERVASLANVAALVPEEEQ